MLSDRSSLRAIQCFPSFHRIGRLNTTCLTKIEIEGTMKNSLEYENAEGEVTFDVLSLGLPRILPILTAVFKNTCPHLRALTLHMDDNAYNFEEASNRRFDDDPANKACKTDDERVDAVVERVVEDLDSLEVLQLGGHKAYKKPDGEMHWEYKDLWGSSTRWMKIVPKRAEGRAKEKAAKEMEARVAKMAI